MKHRRLDPKELAVELRRTTGVVGMSANELDAAADQVRAMGTAIKEVLSTPLGGALKRGMREQLEETITPRSKETPIAKVTRLRHDLDAELAELVKPEPGPDVHSALLGLVETLGNALPAMKRNHASALGKAYQAALAVLAEQEQPRASHEHVCHGGPCSVCGDRG